MEPGRRDVRLIPLNNKGISICGTSILMSLHIGHLLMIKPFNSGKYGDVKGDKSCRDHILQRSIHGRRAPVV